jgi:hypothetical protein
MIDKLYKWLDKKALENGFYLIYKCSGKDWCGEEAYCGKGKCTHTFKLYQAKKIFGIFPYITAIRPEKEIGGIER